MPLPRLFVPALCLALLCTAAPQAQAQAAQAARPAASNSQSSADTAVSLLGGKLRFALPAGYQATPLPHGEAAQGTAGAEGTLYMNESQKRIVVATQLPLQNDAGAAGADEVFLAGVSEGFITQQAQALADFHKTGEAQVILNGLPAQRLDATASIGGGKTLTTYFIVAEGKRMAVIQVISREADRSGHDAMVQRILGKHP